MSPVRLYIYHLVVRALPLTRFFRLKAALLRWAGAEIGRNVKITSSARFQITGSLRIGDGSWLGEDLLVTGGEADIVIGARVDIGPRVTMVTGSHVLWERHDRAAGAGFSKPIVVKDGVWLGACSTILSGVVIGDSAMIAAGAVVVGDVAEATLVAGVPAKIVRVRRGREEVDS